MMWMVMVMMNIMTVMIGMIVIKTKSATITTATNALAKLFSSLYTSKEAKQNRVVGGVYIIMWGPHGDRWSIYIT